MAELEINIKPTTSILMLGCTIIFLISIYFPLIIDYLKLDLGNLLTNPFVIITNAFLHGSWTHYVYNMFTLFFFGTALESRAGSKKTIALFFFSVILGNTFFILMYPESSAIGISGFVYGLMGSLLLINPKIKILFPLGFLSIPMPIFVAAPLIFVGELILSFAGLYEIAHIAHVGGFIAGFILGLIERFKRKKVF